MVKVRCTRTRVTQSTISPSNGLNTITRDKPGQFRNDHAIADVGYRDDGDDKAELARAGALDV